ncbi:MULTISPECIES: MmcQ/YjbR family DNA-binding protein [Micromonospora]|uniref:MmcQ/YjbR family DNA-binding protein n=1 Tax=Micromonospora TaxID=1873 RepID=UPI0020B77D69|nr:MmcQ/YjbR family DNA-binding protein [Micromonospora sp. A3M-1-15]MCP3785625.1 MmcQ/YjbR family DNA-binding protein [Micromonospora sp. A3M-1-15]
MVTVDEVRALARTLPRTSEHLIHDRIKFRVGAIVYVAFSRDEQTMGFGYPKEQRDGLIAAEPALFFLPRPSDLRFNWVCCHLERLDHDQMTELVCEAWRMVVPKFLARQRLGEPGPPGLR